MTFLLLTLMQSCNKPQNNIGKQNLQSTQTVNLCEGDIQVLHNTRTRASIHVQNHLCVCCLLLAALNQGTAMERFECACSTVEWTLWMENIIIAVFKEGCYRWTFVNAFNLVLRLPYQNYYQFHVMYFSCSNVMSCKLWLLKFLIWNIFKECNPTDCIIR